MLLLNLIQDSGNFDINIKGNISVNPYDVIIDPSVLFILGRKEIRQSFYNIYIPDNLLRLIERAKEDSNYREFLERFLSYFRYWKRYGSYNWNWNLFYDNLDRLKIRPITFELIENEDYSNLYGLFLDNDYSISMSPVINLLADTIAKILLFSKRTGMLIVSGTRRLAHLLREKITSIELPTYLANLDGILQVKNEFSNILFGFNGGRALKFFIGICINFAAGENNPFLQGLGTAFMFLDP